MRYLLSFAALCLLSTALITSSASADDPFEWTEDIGPQEMAGLPLIPSADAESMDISISSDQPLTVFIVDTQEGYADLIALSEGDIENFTDYVLKYEDVWNKDITQDYDPDRSYWVILYNPSETETAEVTVEYEFWEEFGEEVVEDALSDACCLLTMGAGAAGICILVGTIMFARSRK